MQYRATPESIREPLAHRWGESDNHWVARLPAVGLETSSPITAIALDRKNPWVTELPPTYGGTVELFGETGWWRRVRADKLNLRKPLRPGDRIEYEVRSNPNVDMNGFLVFKRVVHADEAGE